MCGGASCRENIRIDRVLNDAGAADLREGDLADAGSVGGGDLGEPGDELEERSEIFVGTEGVEREEVEEESKECADLYDRFILRLLLDGSGRSLR